MTEATKRTVKVPLNRVEGDLEVRAQIEDGVVTEAWCSGTMFRGIENVLVGRGALDGLVFTPRICGICGTCHLTAAALALDHVAKVEPPPDAVRVRNACLLAEHCQSDVRHAFLLFAVDLVDPAYRNAPLYDEVVRRYAPFKGETVLEVVRETKRLLELVAIFGGQWPHSSWMLPGGIASIPTVNDFVEARLVVRAYRKWYERRILGCPIERWTEVRSRADLERWLAESDSHRQSELGLFLRLAPAIGLDKVGKGHGRFLSFGVFDIPEGSAVADPGGGKLVPAGFATASQAEPFDQALVAEDVASSWYEDGPEPRHPSNGLTHPQYGNSGDKKYSWAKAPRYKGLPAETSPLAEKIVARHPLYLELVAQSGPTVFVRELARLVRQVGFLPALDLWLSEATGKGPFYRDPGPIQNGEGAGLTQAARGALGHWVKIENGKIARYQVITPTAWNVSPRDRGGVRGPIEEALIGTPVENPERPIELGHVVRSFDACLVCSVHAVSKGRTLGRLKVGV